MNIPPPPLPPMFNRVPGAPGMIQPPNDTAFLTFRGSRPTFRQSIDFRPDASRSTLPLGFTTYPPPPPNVVNNFQNLQPSRYSALNQESSSTSLFIDNNEIWLPPTSKVIQNEIANTISESSTYNLFRHLNPELTNRFPFENLDKSSSNVSASLPQTPFLTVDSNNRLADAGIHQKSSTFELFDGKNLFSGSTSANPSAEETTEPTATFSLFADSK
uniref:Uncharacterized protein n=1 Tax=Romanomermis culicivorax TaxID=13658 RepID=A0A915K3S0_ROMCU